MIKKWEKKEKKDAKDFVGRRQKGSGNYWAAPSDVKSSDFLTESKYTDKNSYSISREKWKKISDEALFSYKYPMMSIQIKDVEIVVLSKEDFIKLIQQKKS